MKNLHLVKSEQFGSITCDIYRDDQEFWMTREQIGSALEYADPQKAIDNLHSRNPERLDRFSVAPKLRATDGKTYSTRLYSARGVYEICRLSRQPRANQFFDWVYDLLETLRTGQATVVPVGNLSPELQMFNKLFQSLAAQELKQKQIEEQLQITQHRVDNLDALNIKGDKQQRLNAMIRKYALDNGLAFSVAWKHFVQAFNTSFRTNLELLKTNYPKKVSTPEYLAATGRLEDALRVADKMLNMSEGA